MVCCTALVVACGGGETTTNSGGTGGTNGTGGTGSGGDAPIAPDFPDPDEPEAGCGTLTEAEARSIATGNLQTVLSGALDSVRFAEGSAALARALSLGGGGHLEFVADSEEGIADLVEQLGTTVLATENFESAEGSTVTFKMQPDVVCPATDEELANDPEGAAEDEASCRDSLAQHDVRVRITRIDCGPSDSVELTVQVSTEPLEPLRVQLNPHSASVALDVKDATVALERLGSFDEGVTFDSDLGGVIGAKIALSANDAATFDLEALEDVAFGGTDAEGERIRIWATAAQLLHLRAEPGLQEITGTVAAKAAGFDLKLSQFIRSFLDREPTALVVNFSAPGLDGSFSYAGGTDTLTVTGLGLAGGPIKASWGEILLLTIDWNVAAERALDFILTPSGENASITLGEAGLDLELEYSMSLLADRVADHPAFTNDDTLHVKFGPNAPVALLYESPEVDVDDLLITGAQEGSLLRVESGSLELTSRAVPAENVTVEAGQCLLRDSNILGEHAFLGSLSGGACP
jgi:hypothetical protein